VDQWDFEGWNNVLLKPKQSASTARRVVLYMHDGGFVGDITSQHWKTIAKLTCKLDSDTIVVPYPLAPMNGVDEVRFLRFRVMRRSFADIS
jgi:acetyl esterase/lipase